MALAYSPIEETKTAAEILAGYKAARARLWAKPAVVLRTSIPAPYTVRFPAFKYTDIQARRFMAEAHSILSRAPSKVDVDPFAMRALPRILSACSVAGGLYDNEIISSSRKDRIVMPRQAFFYLGKKYSTASLKHLGRACGGKDHTTVLHGIRMGERAVTLDPTSKLAKIIIRAMGILEGKE